jgi:hypothetical protein
MKITKKFIKDVFEEAKEKFQKEIMKLPVEVDLEFESKEDFMKSVKENPLIQQQIQIGIYKDIDNEYVGFAVVYAKNKIEFRKIFGLPYIITICDEIAKRVLKPLSTYEAKIYLLHVFAHEFSHLFENEIKQKRPEIWKKCLQQTRGIEHLAHEMLSEEIADMLVNDTETYKKVEDIVWYKIKKRISQIQKGR